MNKQEQIELITAQIESLKVTLKELEVESKYDEIVKKYEPLEHYRSEFLDYATGKKYIDGDTCLFLHTFGYKFYADVITSGIMTEPGKRFVKRCLADLLPHKYRETKIHDMYELLFGKDYTDSDLCHLVTFYLRKTQKGPNSDLRGAVVRELYDSLDTLECFKN